MSKRHGEENRETTRFLIKIYIFPNAKKIRPCLESRNNWKEKKTKARLRSSNEPKITPIYRSFFSLPKWGVDISLSDTVPQQMFCFKKQY